MKILFLTIAVLSALVGIFEIGEVTSPTRHECGFCDAVFEIKGAKKVLDGEAADCWDFTCPNCKVLNSRWTSPDETLP
jgi:phage FluMu protein Com